MNQAKKLSGITLASAAAALLISGVGTTVASAAGHEKMADIKCSGINSCKGTSACATATSGCAGQNSCKGHGWVKATAEECKAKGGEILTDAK